MRAFSWGYEHYPPMPINAVLPKTKGVYNIPKIIHYCWFGHNAFPESAKQCLASWGKYCPDYKTKQWNEKNYDISSAPLYVRQAYEAGKYAFVSDYVRLDVIYRHGGLYLDTDVELLDSLDDFISYKAFFGFKSFHNDIATGLGFGSISHNKTLRELMNLYNHIDFIKPDGSYNIIDCPRYTNEYFRRKDVSIMNKLQLVDNTLFLSSDYMCPLDAVQCSNGIYQLLLYALTNNTHSIHHCDSSWYEKESLDAFNSAKKNFKTINDRLLGDWLKYPGQR
jgi:hypothetical protein